MPPGLEDPVLRKPAILVSLVPTDARGAGNPGLSQARQGVIPRLFRQRLGEASGKGTFRLGGEGVPGVGVEAQGAKEGAGLVRPRTGTRSRKH